MKTSVAWMKTSERRIQENNSIRPAEALRSAPMLPKQRVCGNLRHTSPTVHGFHHGIQSQGVAEAEHRPAQIGAIENAAPGSRPISKAPAPLANAMTLPERRRRRERRVRALAGGEHRSPCAAADRRTRSRDGGRAGASVPPSEGIQGRAGPGGCRHAGRSDQAEERRHAATSRPEVSA
jgi:hypothetical protein